MRLLRPCTIPLLLLVTSCAAPRSKICDHIHLEDGRLKLNGNEHVLVCGSDKGGEGWREVPLPQAQFELKGVLQNLGFLNPRFERRQNELYVWQGERRRVTELEIRGADGLLEASRKRLVVGEPLTPEKLDEVKQWAETQLEIKGYACPKVDVRAQAWDGRIILNVQTGPRVRVRGIDYSGLSGLDVQSLARDQAMQPGDWYDVRETQLTASRMLNDALFQTAYFTEDCHPDGMVDLHLHTEVGKPRIFRFGVGASTEEFPFTSIWFKDARLDDRASSFTAKLYASPRQQSLDVSSEFYHWPWTKRSYLGPRFTLSRQDESDYEVNQANAGVDVGRLWDMWKTRFRAKVGPTLNYQNTVRGIGPHEVAYITWDGGLTAISRDYELFSRDLYSGWQGDFSYRGQRKGVGSPINADRYELDFRNYWNIGNLMPPYFVLGGRMQGIAVNYTRLTTNPGNERELLPLDDRVFYGGDANLRGFNRQALDNRGLGYLTALYGGLELRLIELLPYRLEPFLLFDVAQLGDRRLTLDRPIFLSEGLGLRWASPFGTLRGSLAKGRIMQEDKNTEDYPQEWVWFVSFGQEF